MNLKQDQRTCKSDGKVICVQSPYEKQLLVPIHRNFIRGFQRGEKLRHCLTRPRATLEIVLIFAATRFAASETTLLASWIGTPYLSPWGSFEYRMEPKLYCEILVPSNDQGPAIPHSLNCAHAVIPTLIVV